MKTIKNCILCRQNVKYIVKIYPFVQDKKINPIEVKSGNYKKHTSIDRFKKRYKKSVGTRYVLHTKDLEVDGDVVYLPLYMAMFL